MGEYLVEMIGTDAGWPYQYYRMTIEKDGITSIGIQGSPGSYTSYLFRLKCDLSAPPVKDQYCVGDPDGAEHPSS